MINRLVRVAQWAALLAPAAVVFYLVLRYGVNVPYADQWTLVNPMARMVTGKFHWTEFFAQHNEHRILFPKLIMVGLAHLTHWNIRAELLASIAICVGTLAVLATLMRPVLRDAGPAVGLWASLTLSAMLFSLVQWENWLWGWQIQWFLNIFAAVSSIALATRSLEEARPWPYVAAAAVAAIVSQYSLAGGIAAWPASGLVLAFHPRRRVVLPVWIALAVAMTALYFIGYVKPAYHPSPLVAIEHPVGFLLYLGNYLSGALGRRAAIGFAVGTAFVVLASTLIVRHRREPALVLPWIALGIFAGANAIITAIGRVGLGPEQALESRYTTMALLMSVALVPLGILGWRAWSRDSRTALRRIVGFGGAAALTISVLATDVTGLRGWMNFNERMVAGRDCLLVVDDAPDACLLHLYPGAAIVRDLARQLPTLGWGALGESAAGNARSLVLAGPAGSRSWQVAPDDGTVGVLDEVNVAGGTLIVRGWARHPAGNMGAVRKVLVAAGGKVLGEAEIVGDRPDVEAHFRDPNLRRSGWELRTADSATVTGIVQAYLVIDDNLLAPVGGRRIDRGR